MKSFYTTYKNPITVLIIIILLGGVFAYSKMQTALFPEITFPKIKIIADAGQQPVDKMMITVTRQLENAIKQVPDLQTIRSTTSRGSCELSAFLNWNADVDLAQQRIQSKISEITNILPPGVSITVERMNPSILPVMGYSLESHTRSAIEMQMLATYTIKPYLSRVAGVSEVRVIGGKTKEYDVVLNQQKMNALGITPSMVSDVIAQNNIVQSNGYLNDYRQMYLTVTDASVNSLQQLQNIVVSNNKRITLLKDIADVNINSEKPKTWFSFFWVGFIAGLVAVFMPCLYPLFPVTVTYFMHHYDNKKRGRRNALFYSLCIILIYGIPTTALTLIFGDTTLYKISINPVTNLFFFAIFIVFALSFFGLFEITLPSSWSTHTDKLAGKGGYLGIFFMALTLVIVSFSCTGIVAGQLLSYLSSEGIAGGPIAGMFGFGTGLALPFTLLALFPSLIHAMPKSGGWLNTVKVSFAFIELAMALKFLSNVDLIYHWRLLDREIFIALWIVLSVLLGYYLLGKIKFYHDSDIKHVSIMRLFFAIASFTFALYLLPGMWGAPLKALSGWIPPEYTQDFNLYNAHSSTSSTNDNQAALPPKKFADKIAAPFGLRAYFDLDEGIAAAKILHKPIMLDFTGYSCANCRKMEAQVLSDPEVLKRINENFVLVSLYVDEPTELSPTEKYTNTKGEQVTTEGEKNLDYEITKFGFNAQPLYMFMDAGQNILSDIKYGYDPDIDKFIKHLDEAKKKFDGALP